MAYSAGSVQGHEGGEESGKVDRRVEKTIRHPHFGLATGGVFGGCDLSGIRRALRRAAE